MVVSESGLMCPKQAAVFLRVSVSTLATWRVRRAGPPFVRVGRSIRYDAHALNKWVEANSVQPMKVA